MPRCTTCSTKLMRNADEPSSCTFFVTASAPWPTTTTVRLMSQPPSAASTCSSIGRPQSRWSGFGRVERMRVPSPAASTMADSVMSLFYQRERERQASYGESSCVCRPGGSRPRRMGPSRRPCRHAAGRHVDRRDARVPDQLGAREHRRIVRREPSHQRTRRRGARSRRRAVRRDGSQVIFGPSATALVFAFTRALARTWTGSERIVCTQLDHDSNVTPWVLGRA